MIDFQTALAQGRVTPDQARALFDSLAPVASAFMLGDWEGSPFPTGHPMDGALEATGWRGKRFVSLDEVHPLIFDDGQGGAFAVHPGRFMARPVPGKASDRKAELQTDQPAARLRQMEIRGQVTAAMVYDDLPIIDLFKRVDADMVLGLMDMRGMDQTYFFVLRRMA